MGRKLLGYRVRGTSNGKFVYASDTNGFLWVEQPTMPDDRDVCKLVAKEAMKEPSDGFGDSVEVSDVKIVAVYLKTNEHASSLAKARVREDLSGDGSMFDLSTPAKREMFQRAMIASDPKAIEHVSFLATKLGVHLAYDSTSPGLFVQRNDPNKEAGTIVGICGGRRFLVNDWAIDGLVEDWQHIEKAAWSNERKSMRALAVLVLICDMRPDIEGYSVDHGKEMIEVSPDLIVQHLKLREEVFDLRATIERMEEEEHDRRMEAREEYNER
jgi:hypothetical protein